MQYNLGKQIDVSLFPLDRRSHDGSIIPKQVAEQWLQSEDFIERIDTRTMYVNLTHIHRQLIDETHANYIADLDEALLQGNIHGYIEDIWIDNYKDAEYCIARIMIFDSENYYPKGSKSYEYIQTILRLLQHGSRPPVSSAILAYWDDSVADTSTCTEIVTIFGVDFTLRPSFNSTEVLAIYD